MQCFDFNNVGGKLQVKYLVAQKIHFTKSSESPAAMCLKIFPFFTKHVICVHGQRFALYLVYN